MTAKRRATRRSVLGCAALTAALVGGSLPIGQARADGDTLCSTLVGVGAITNAATFDAAIAEVNAGDCNVINVTGNIAFSTAPTPITSSGSGSTLTISGPSGGSVTLDGKDGSASAVQGLAIALISLSESTRVVIANLTFTEFVSSESGGALRTNAPVTIQNSTFSANEAISASKAGGAVFSSATSSPAVVSENSRYLNNRSRQGGAINSDSGAVSSTGDQFVGNQATELDGGAIHALRVTSTNSLFDANTAALWGGAVETRSMVDSGSGFEDNSAVGRGGAIYCIGGASGSLTLNGTTFDRNTTGAGGGGAIWTDSPTSATSAHFTGNSADTGAPGPGGAIVVDSSLTLTDTDFTSNRAGSTGGAIEITRNSPTSITRGSFTRNSASREGGAISTEGTITATAARFISNTAGVDGGGAINAKKHVELTSAVFESNRVTTGSGGAVYAVTTITVTDSTFTTNGRTSGYTSGTGGAIHAEGIATVSGSIFSGNAIDNYGGAIYSNSNAPGSAPDLTLRNNTFSTNHGGGGGAFYARGKATVERSTFTSNTANVAGGALLVDDTITLSDSTFRANQSGSSGGAVDALHAVMTNSSFINNAATYFGGAAFIRGSLSATNSTFSGNSSGSGGIHFNSSVTSAHIVFSTLVSSSTPGFGSVLTADVALDSSRIRLIGSVIAGTTPACGGEDRTNLNVAAHSSRSFATDTSCGGSAGSTDINTAYSSASALGLTTAVTTDTTPGRQVLIPDASSVLNAYAPLSVLPSGVTTDQLGAARNAANALTSAGAVQVRPISISGPATTYVSPGSAAAFAITAVAGVGTEVTYQWQRNTGGGWSNISGNASALTATLTLPSVSEGDSGTQFRAVVTNVVGGASSTSTVATLTVGYAPAPNVDPSTPTPSQSSSATPSSSITSSPSATTAPPSTTSSSAGARPVIVGARQGSEVTVRGQLPAAAGKLVTPHAKIQGQRRFHASQPVRANSQGQFTWRLRCSTAVSVYFTAPGARSTTVIIPAQGQGGPVRQTNTAPQCTIKK